MRDSLLRSIYIHVLLVFIVGCAIRKPATIHNPAIGDGVTFVDNIASLMPKWDADVKFAQYERTEIATVKADIEVAKLATTEAVFLSDVSKLHKDWDALVALDELLRQRYLS